MGMLNPPSATYDVAEQAAREAVVTQLTQWGFNPDRHKRVWNGLLNSPISRVQLKAAGYKFDGGKEYFYNYLQERATSPEVDFSFFKPAFADKMARTLMKYSFDSVEFTQEKFSDPYLQDIFKVSKSAGAGYDSTYALLEGLRNSLERTAAIAMLEILPPFAKTKKAERQ